MKVPQYDSTDFYKSQSFWSAVVTPLVAVFLPYVLQYVPFPLDVNQTNVVVWLSATLVGLFTHKVVRVLRGLK